MPSNASAANHWINTLESQNAEHFMRVAHILQDNRFCTLATCSADGLPWASPLLYGYDQTLTLYWSSAIAAQHSEYLECNQGRSAVTIYDSQAQPGNIAGLFLMGITQVVSGAQTEHAMNRLFDRMATRPERSATDYLGDSPRRVYQFSPQQVWITGTREPVGQQLVDTKIQLDLDQLLAHFATSFNQN